MQQLQSWYQQEAPGNTDTADVDQQVAQLVNNNPELYQQLQAQTQLKGSDSSQPDVAVDDSSIDQEPDLEPASKETQVNRSVIGTWVGTDKRLDFEVGAMNGTDRDGNLVEKVLHFKEGGVLDREDKPLDGGVDYSWEQVDADHVKTIVDYEGLHYEITYKLEGDKLISTKVFAGFNGETSENNDVYAKQVLKRSQ